MAEGSLRDFSRTETEAERVLHRYSQLMSHPQVRALCSRNGRVFIAMEGVALNMFNILYGEGHRYFSHKYLNELNVIKQELPGLPVSYYGRLQSRKVKDIAASCGQIESVARFCEAERLHRLTYSGPLFIQVNISEEPQKNGIMYSSSMHEIERLLKLPLNWVGLMAIPAQRIHPSHAFRNLRQLADYFSLKRCMMGMSADFDIAIEEGATDIRVRRVLFG